MDVIALGHLVSFTDCNFKNATLVREMAVTVPQDSFYGGD